MRKALVPVVLALAATTACGSGSSATESLSPLEQVRAAASTAEAGSNKIDLSVRSKAGGQDVTFGGTGAFSYGSSGTSGVMKITVAGQELEERILGGDLYLKVPGKEGFYKLALKDLVGTQLADSSNPASSAKVLSAIDDVKKVGTETLHGDKTTHYTGTIDIAKATSQVSGDIAKAAIQKLAESGVTTLPVEVFLDDKGRLRRLTEHVALTVKGTKADVTTVLDFYDFGTKVDVEAPPADQVKDGAEILAALKGATG